MRGITHPALVGGAAVAAALALSGCATEAYVDTAVAGVQSQVTANTAKINEHDARLASLDGRVSAAQARADAAYGLAQGKFATTKLGEEVLLFDTGKFLLSDDQKAKLDELVGRLTSENRNVYLEIEGQADARGSDQANRLLSARRAYAVYDHLRSKGVGLNRMQVIALGEEYPVAPDDTASGREQNRRVVISIVQ